MKRLSMWILILLFHGASGADAERVSVSVMEGDSVTLHTGVRTNQETTIVWFFNNNRIAEITGNQSNICTDVQCKERFRDRLKLDHQTGSLTITHTTNTDSGEYKLEIIIISSSSSNNQNIFSVNVTDSGLSPATVAGISAAVVAAVVAAAVAVAAVIYYRKHQGRRKKGSTQPNHDEQNASSDPSVPLMKTNGASHDPSVPLMKTNGASHDPSVPLMKTNGAYPDPTKEMSS